MDNALHTPVDQTENTLGLVQSFVPGKEVNTETEGYDVLWQPVHQPVISPPAFVASDCVLFPLGSDFIINMIVKGLLVLYPWSVSNSSVQKERTNSSVCCEWQVLGYEGFGKRQKASLGTRHIGQRASPWNHFLWNALILLRICWTRLCFVFCLPTPLPLVRKMLLFDSI